MDTLTLLEELISMPDQVRGQVLQRATDLRKARSMAAAPIGSNNIPEQASLADLITGNHAMGPQIVGTPAPSAETNIRSKAGKMGALQTALRRP